MNNTTEQPQAPALTAGQSNDLDTFTRAYIECAFWSSCDDNGEPLDRNYSISCLSPTALARMVADCREFQHGNCAKLAYVTRLCDDARSGHNFWLNRNGHGSGFWDEYFGDDLEMRDCFVKLSDASKAWGYSDLYVGDDGQIHVSPNDSYYLPGGFGCWDVTSFPFGGDFIRPKTDLALTNLRPSEKAGYMLADAAYPPRRGVRTLCIQSIHIKGQ